MGGSAECWNFPTFFFFFEPFPYHKTKVAELEKMKDELKSLNDNQEVVLSNITSSIKAHQTQLDSLHKNNKNKKEIQTSLHNIKSNTQPKLKVNDKDKVSSSSETHINNISRNFFIIFCTLNLAYLV